MTPDVARMKRLFLQMALLDGVLMLAAVGFAYAYFGRGLEWALYGFMGFIAAAFAVQLWFVARVARAKKGN